eukprot:PhM_4_TR3588/c0_g1_i1/m.10858
MSATTSATSSLLRTRQRYLTEYLRQCGQWRLALDAVTDAAFHHVPFDRPALDSTLRVFLHDSTLPRSVQPLRDVVAYYAQYGGGNRHRKKRLLPTTNSSATTTSQYSEEDVAGMVQGWREDAATEQLYLKVCRAHGAWQDALSVLTRDVLDDTQQQQQQQQLRQLDALTHSLVIDTCHATGQWHRALTAYTTPEVVAQLWAAPRGVTPGLVTSLVKAVAAGATGQWDLAMETFRLATSGGDGAAVAPEGPTYDYLVQALGRCERHANITDVIAAALRASVPLHETTLRIGLEAAEERTDWELSLVLYRTLAMHNCKIDNSVLEQVTRAAAGAGQWRVAAAMLHELKDHGLSLAASPYLMPLVFAARLEHVPSRDGMALLSKAMGNAAMMFPHAEPFAAVMSRANAEGNHRYVLTVRGWLSRHKLRPNVRCRSEHIVALHRLGETMQVVKAYMLARDEGLVPQLSLQAMEAVVATAFSPNCEAALRAALIGDIETYSKYGQHLLALYKNNNNDASANSSSSSTASIKHKSNNGETEEEATQWLDVPD